MDSLELFPVTLDAANFLYRLLMERDPEVNISHRSLPKWADHLAFIKSNPYEAWYIIAKPFPAYGETDRRAWIGANYLTKQDEIGLFFLKEYQGNGYGPEALRLLMEKHPRPRYLANVAPLNVKSQKFFARQGFTMIQHTYELRAA